MAVVGALEQLLRCLVVYMVLDLRDDGRIILTELRQPLRDDPLGRSAGRGIDLAIRAAAAVRIANHIAPGLHSVPDLAAVAVVGPTPPRSNVRCVIWPYAGCWTATTAAASP